MRLARFAKVMVRPYTTGKKLIVKIAKGLEVCLSAGMGRLVPMSTTGKGSVERQFTLAFIANIKEGVCSI